MCKDSHDSVPPQSNLSTLAVAHAGIFGIRLAVTVTPATQEGRAPACAAREFGKWAARLLATDEQASFVRREAERGQEQAQGQASDGEEGAVVEVEHDELEHEDNAASLLLPPPAGYVGRGAAEALYALLGAAQDGAAPATDQQAFFDLLQRAGEEAGLLDLEDETLDECVPLAVVEEAVASHAEAFAEDLAGVLQ